MYEMEQFYRSLMSWIILQSGSTQNQTLSLGGSHKFSPLIGYRSFTQDAKIWRFHMIRSEFPKHWTLNSLEIMTGLDCGYGNGIKIGFKMSWKIIVLNNPKIWTAFPMIWTQQRWMRLRRGPVVWAKHNECLTDVPRLLTRTFKETEREKKTEFYHKKQTNKKPRMCTGRQEGSALTT